MKKRNKRNISKLEQTKKLFEKFWLLGIILFAGIFYLIMLNYTGALGWDEMVYLSNARSHITPSFFYEDFRFPLLELTIAGPWLITGESILVAQIIIILFSLAGIYGFGLLAKQYLATSMSAIATSLFTISSPLLWGFRIYTDVPAMTLTIFATYFFIKYLQTKNNQHIFISGLFCSLAFLMRFPTAIVAVSIGIYVLLTKNWTSIKQFALGNLLILSPWLIINTIAYNNPLWDFMAQSQIVSQVTIWQSPLILIQAIQHTFSYSLIFLIPFLYWIWIEKKSTKAQVLITLLSTHIIVYLFFVNLKFERYILMFLPFIILAISIGLQQTRRVSKKIFNKKIALITTIIIFTILVHFILSYSIENIEKNNQQANCEKNGALNQATTYIAETVPMGKTILSNHWPWFGYYGNHQTLAIYNSSISSILDLHHVKPSKVIYMQYQGLYFNTKELKSDSRLIPEVTFTDNCGFKVEVYSVEKNR